MNSKLSKRISLVTVLAVLATGLLGCGSTQNSASGYPKKAVNIIIPFAAGGSSDLLMRPFIQVAQKYMKKPFVLVNKPGAGGVTGITELSNAAPDGYNIGLSASGPLSTQPLINEVPYDSIEDFEYIAGLIFDPVCIAVKSDAPYNTLDEFFAAAEGRRLLWSCASVGSVSHLAGEALLKTKGFQGDVVPTAGGSESVTNLLGGHVEFIICHLTEVVSSYTAGEVKVLALMDSERNELLPDVPTCAELGEDLEFGVAKGLIAPKGTPPEVLAYLDDICQKVLSDPEFTEMTQKVNLFPAYESGEDYRQRTADELAVFEPLISEADLK